MAEWDLRRRSINSSTREMLNPSKVGIFRGSVAERLKLDHHGDIPKVLVNGWTGQARSSTCKRAVASASPRFFFTCPIGPLFWPPPSRGARTLTSLVLRWHHLE